jgi:hypothetical protein
MTASIHSPAASPIHAKKPVNTGLSAETGDKPPEMGGDFALLFANMMAGHTLVKILSGFAWTMMSVGGIMTVVSFIPFLVVFALTFLEVGVACLQAYVFTILTCIYLNDAINLH